MTIFSGLHRRSETNFQVSLVLVVLGELGGFNTAGGSAALFGNTGELPLSA